MSVYGERLERVSVALADPTRREIMELVCASERPLSAREVAEHFGLHVNAARMHLDKLVKGGILEMMRSRGRKGGRPAHLYRYSDEDLELSFPSRHYRILAEVLATVLDGRLESALPSCGEEAFARGRDEAVRLSPTLTRLREETDPSAVAEAWAEEIRKRGHGARLLRDGPGEAAVAFSSCPFGDLARRHPRLVCEVHRRFEEGYLSLAGDFELRGGVETGCSFSVTRRSGA